MSLIYDFSETFDETRVDPTRVYSFSQALELACFYTPLSAQRLDEFTRARRLRYQRTTRFAQISEFEREFDPGTWVSDRFTMDGVSSPGSATGLADH